MCDCDSHIVKIYFCQLPCSYHSRSFYFLASVQCSPILASLILVHNTTQGTFRFVIGEINFLVMKPLNRISLRLRVIWLPPSRNLGRGEKRDETRPISDPNATIIVFPALAEMQMRNKTMLCRRRKMHGFFRRLRRPFYPYRKLFW